MRVVLVIRCFVAAHFVDDAGPPLLTIFPIVASRTARLGVEVGLGILRTHGMNAANVGSSRDVSLHVARWLW